MPNPDYSKRSWDRTYPSPVLPITLRIDFKYHGIESIQSLDEQGEPALMTAGMWKFLSDFALKCWADERD